VFQEHQSWKNPDQQNSSCFSIQSYGWIWVLSTNREHFFYRVLFWVGSKSGNLSSAGVVGESWLCVANRHHHHHQPWLYYYYDYIKVRYKVGVAARSQPKGWGKCGFFFPKSLQVQGLDLTLESTAVVSPVVLLSTVVFCRGSWSVHTQKQSTLVPLPNNPNFNSKIHTIWLSKNPVFFLLCFSLSSETCFKKNFVLASYLLRCCTYLYLPRSLIKMFRIPLLILL